MSGENQFKCAENALKLKTGRSALTTAKQKKRTKKGESTMNYTLDELNKMMEENGNV